MSSDARKMHLLEEVIKLQDEAILSQLEHVLLHPSLENKPKNSARNLVGIFDENDLEVMEKAIDEGCGQVNPDDWK
jgi:hypothetical protein